VRDQAIAVAHAAAALAFAAALIHGSVIASHFREYWLFGLFFVLVTPLQIAWAEGVRRAPADRRLLSWGAWGSLGIVVIWLVSRLVGLPFGPERFQPEAVSPKDLLASYDEIAIVVLVATLLLRGGSRPAPAWCVAGAWVLVAASGLAAFIGGH
jgi:hypothetical protein